MEIIKFKNIELDRNDLNQLQDVIVDIFNVNVNHSQIEKLLTITFNFDGVVDTLGRDDFADDICKHFIKMRVPRYGDSKEFKDKFWLEIENSKSNFIEFINT